MHTPLSPVDHDDARDFSDTSDDKTTSNQNGGDVVDTVANKHLNVIDVATEVPSPISVKPSDNLSSKETLKPSETSSKPTTGDVPEIVYQGRSSPLPDTSEETTTDKPSEDLLPAKETEKKKLEKQSSRESLSEEKRKQDAEDLQQQLVAIDTQIAEYLHQVSRLRKTKSDLGFTEDATATGKEARDGHTSQLSRPGFVSKEGSLRVYELIRGFNDLNSSISDLGYEVLLSIDASAEERCLLPEQYEDIHKTLGDPNLKLFLESISRFNLTAIDIIDPIVEYLLCTQLLHTVFRPFAPGLDMELSENLQKIYERIRKVEPQDDSGRWRSLTFAHSAAIRDDYFLQNAVDEFMSKVSKVLTVLVDDAIPTLSAECTLAALRIFEMSCKLQEKMKTEYKDFTYDVNLPTCGQTYNSLSMEISQAAGNSAELVWLPVGLGLVESRTIIKSDQSVILEDVVHVKAKVLCDNFVDRWTCPRLEGVQIGKHMYGGPYASVYTGRWENKDVAIKIINPMHGKSLEGMKKKLTRELEIWWSLKHPRIAPLYGLAEPFGNFGGMISQWYKNGNAQEYLLKFDLTMEQRIILWAEVVEAVAYLHGCDPIIVHGDLKPANILIDDEGHARLCDFGLVRLITEYGHTGLTTTSAFSGTVRYLSKELCTASDDRVPTTASDIHAVGCVGLELLFGILPYGEHSNNFAGQITMDIREGKAPAGRPCGLSADETAWWNNIEFCWAEDPHDRPSAAQLLGLVTDLRTRQTINRA